MKPYILPYKKGSRGAANLAEALNCYKILTHGSRFIHRPNKLVINWGNTNLEHPAFTDNGPILNIPNSVKIARNKLTTFMTLENSDDPNPIAPPWTIDQDRAMRWLQEGFKVFVRHSLEGQSGSGIEVLNRGANAIPEGPLDVRYIPKEDEYRVHVFLGEVIDFSKKKRRMDVADEDVNWDIRTFKNGFIYARGGVSLPEQAKEISIKAVERIGLDFGAVDVIKHKRRNEFYVLEVNTAPGIVGTTVERYRSRIEQFCSTYD